MNKLIKITNYKNTNHIIEIYKDGVKLETDSKITEGIIIYTLVDYSEQDIYEIRIINDCLRSKMKAVIYGIIFWIAALAGAVDNINDSAPVNSILKFSSRTDVNIKCLKLGNSEAFDVDGANKVLINKFILEEKVYRRWIYTTICPLECILLFILIVACTVCKVSYVSIMVLVLFCIVQIFLIKYMKKITKYLIRE